MKACRPEEREVKFVMWLSLALPGVLWDVLPSIHTSLVLAVLCCASQIFVVCLISPYLLFVWGWWQSNKLPLGEWSGTCEGFQQKVLPCRSAQFRASPLSTPERTGSGASKGIAQKSAHAVLIEHTEPKRDRFWGR